MKDIINALVVGSLCVLVIACGSRGDQAWLEDSGLSPFAARVQGNWWAECSRSPVGLTEISALFMNHEQMKRTTQISFSVDCNTWDVEAVEDFRFWVNGDMGNNMRELELKLKNVTARPKTIIGATQLNAISWCGISDWAEGVTRDVTAQIGGENCFASRPKEMKSVIKLEGDTLMIGKLESVSTSGTLNKDQAFRRPSPPTPTPIPETTDPVPTPVGTPVPTPIPPIPIPNPNPDPEPDIPGGDEVPPPDDTAPHAHGHLRAH